ncbi:MAG: hypothetical protein ACRD96_18690, partial [Bryobacteraceae bacterium]
MPTHLPRTGVYRYVQALALAIGIATPAIARYGNLPITFVDDRGLTARGGGIVARFLPGEVVFDVPSGLRLRFLGADPAAQIRGLDPQEGRANFLIGADPRLWRRNLPLYGRVVYRRIYPGIDAVFRGEGGRLKT